MKTAILPTLIIALLALSACSGEAEAPSSVASTPVERSEPVAAPASEPTPAEPFVVPELRLSLGHGNEITFLEFSADGRYLLTESKDALLVWEVATRREIRRLVGTRGGPFEIEHALGSRHYLLRSRDSGTSQSQWAVFSLDDLELSPIAFEGSLERFDEERSKLYLMNRTDGALARVQLPEGKVDTLPVRGPIEFLHPNGRWLIVWQDRKSYQVLDLEDLSASPIEILGNTGAFAVVPGTSIVWNAAANYPADYDPRKDENVSIPTTVDEIDLAQKKTLRSFQLKTNNTAPVEMEYESSRLLVHGYGKGGIVDLENETWEYKHSLQIPYEPNREVVVTSAAIDTDRRVRSAFTVQKGREIHAIEIFNTATNSVETSISLGRDEKFSDLRIDPNRGVTEDGTRAAFYNQKVIVVADLVAGTVASTIDRAAIPVIAKELDHLVWDSTTGGLIASWHDPSALLVLLDPATGGIREHFGDSVVRVSKIQGQGSSGLWGIDQDSNLIQLRVTPRGIAVQTTAVEANLFTVSDDGSTVASASWERWNPRVGPADNFEKHGRSVNMMISANDEGYAPDDIVLSPDGSLVATTTSEQLNLRPVKGSADPVLHFYLNRGSSGAVPTGELWVSLDNRYALLMARSEEGGRELQAYRLAGENNGQELLWKRPFPSGGPIWNVDAETWAIRDTDHLLRVDVVSGEVKTTTPLGDEFQGAWHFSPDRAEFFVVFDGRIRFFDTATLSPRGDFAWDADWPMLHYTSSPEIFVGTLGQGLFTGFWRRSADAFDYVARIALLDGGRKWVLLDSDGRFDTAGGVEDRISFALEEGQTIPLGAAFSKLHTPRLWESLMAGIDLPKPAITAADLEHPPTVKLRRSDGAKGPVTEETVSLIVEAFSPRGPLAEIRLFHNGKRVGEGTRGLVVEDDAEDSLTSQTRDYTLALDPGPNLIKAVAVNETGIESDPKELTIRRQGADAGGIRLHVLAVGINQYENPKYNLNYATADAGGVIKTVQAHAQRLFTDVSTEVLLDGEATRAKIIAAFERITAQAGSRDAFLFYYAGHGVMAAGGARQFYLVPTDVTQMYGDDAQLTAKGISSAELLELSKQLPAQKQLFILDACQSAGALETVGGFRGAAEERAIAQLARSSGTHWLTASGSEQFATEFDQLGHGVFTYALLAALDGEADAGDGRVTVNDLKAYLESRVPDLTLEYRGSPQYPASFGYGQDFPVTLIAK